MTDHVNSADGTPIAFDVLGDDGPPVVIVSGMFCDRRTTRDLAEHLARTCRVVNYDRRGRGESGDSAPYAVEREIEDLGALIAAVGGAAAVYGHSSGAGLALLAAGARLPVTRLVLHEPPYGPDDEESRRSARELATGVEAALADGRPPDAIRLFLADAGLPPEVVDGMAADPDMQAVAGTMPHDLAVMGDHDGGTIPEDVARSLDVPTLVIAGGESPDFFRDTATRLAELVPAARLTVLDGHDHGAPAEVVAPAVAAFLVDSPGGDGTA